MLGEGRANQPPKIELRWRRRQRRVHSSSHCFPRIYSRLGMYLANPVSISLTHRRLSSSPPIFSNSA